MSQLSARELVRLLREDREALRELAASIAEEPEVRLTIVNAALAEVATKADVRELRGEMQALRSEMLGHFRWTMGLIVAIWGTTVIPLLMKIAGII